MSSSSERSLKERVLLHLAGLQGPAIDQVDALRVGEVSVREIVREFAETVGSAGGDSPASVRGALLDLVDEKLVRVVHGDEESDFFEQEASVSLRVRGLLRAREMEPACGRVEGGITLRFTKHGLLDARFETGSRERDRELNRAGLSLACFYLVAALAPTRKKPIVAGECVSRLELLAAHGVGVRTGPGDRTRPSEATVRAALDRLESILPLRCRRPGEDKRRVSWELTGALPPVVIERQRRDQFEEWPRLVDALNAILRGRPFVDAAGNVVEPVKVKRAGTPE